MAGARSWSRGCERVPCRSHSARSRWRRAARAGPTRTRWRGREGARAGWRSSTSTSSCTLPRTRCCRRCSPTTRSTPWRCRQLAGVRLLRPRYCSSPAVVATRNLREQRREPGETPQRYHPPGTRRRSSTGSSARLVSERLGVRVPPSALENCRNATAIRYTFWPHLAASVLSAAPAKSLSRTGFWLYRWNPALSPPRAL
jgi:hypothetical protein